MKKMFSAILAAGLMVLPFGTVSLTANATSQYVLLGDANSDGVVGIADAVMTANYLEGNANVASDYQATAMDVNEDCVIDIYDVLMMQQIEAGTITTQTVLKELYSAPDNSTRYYYRHDCSDVSLTSRYVYSISNIPAMNTALDGAAIMKKLEEVSNRLYTMPDSSHGSTVKVTVGTETFSGVFITNNIIATSAENIYNYSTGAFKGNVHVTVYNDSDNSIFADKDALYLHIPQLYATSIGDTRENYNYGLIYISTNISNFDPDIGYSVTTLDDTPTYLTVCGYTSSGRYFSRGPVNPYYYSTSYPTYQMGIDTESLLSFSGGGIYHETNTFSNSSVIGILTNHYGSDDNYDTWGVRMNPTLLKFYKKNPYLTQGGTYYAN